MSQSELDPFDLGPPTPEEELRRLIRAIRMARSFRLHFVRVLPGAARADFFEEIRRAAPDLRIEVLDLNRPADHLRRSIADALEKLSPGPDAVFVTGIESWLPGTADALRSPFVLNLNAARDEFPKTLSCPLVLCTAEHILRAIQRGAPDFFSIASGLYLFPIATEASRESEPETPSPEFVRERLEVLSTVESLLDELENLPPDPVQKAFLLNLKGFVLFELGRYGEALVPIGAALRIRREVLGERHPDTLTSMNNLASLNESEGRYEEARPLYEEALRVQREVLGERHPDTLTSMNNLAALNAREGRYEEARPLYEEALRIRREVLGERHPGTLMSMNNLAALNEREGRYEEARPLYEEVLRIRREVLGERHPGTLTSMNNLAALNAREGRYEEAEALLQPALSEMKKLLGPNHPDVQLLGNNLQGLRALIAKAQEAPSKTTEDSSPSFEA